MTVLNMFQSRLVHTLLRGIGSHYFGLNGKYGKARMLVEHRLDKCMTDYET
jgi:hypothetical protein